MADNSVFVTGVASGAFDDALSSAFGNLPDWATEDTAKSIAATLKSSLKIQTQTLVALLKKSASSGSLPPDELKEVNDQLTSLSNNLAAENKAFPGRKKFFEDEHKQQGQQRSQWKQANGQAAHSLSIDGMLIKAGLAIRQTFIDNVNTFDKLSASGINVMNGFTSAGNGFEALQQLSAITGVRYTELSATLQKYSGAINSFGLKRFATTMTVASTELAKFGFSTKETADLLGVYLESQRGYTNVNGKTQEGIQRDLVKFGERITSVSLATGTLRTKLLEDIAAISQSVEANILAGQISTNASEKTLEFIASFKDKSLGQSFLRMMTDSIKPLNATFMSFQKLGMGGFGQKLMSFTKGLEGLEAADAMGRVKDFVNQNAEELDRMTKHANMLRQAGYDAEANDVLSKINALQQQARLINRMTPEEQKLMQATSESSKKIQSAIERFKAQLQITFAPMTGILDIFTGILNVVNGAFDLIRGFVGGIESFVNQFGLVTAIFGKINIFSLVGFGLAIYATIKKTQLLGAALGMLVPLIRGIAGGGIKGALGGAATGMMGGLGGMMGGTPTVPPGGPDTSTRSSRRAERKGQQHNGPRTPNAKPVGKGGIGAGIGSSVGGMLGGILEGLAKGLSALGTPKVLMGTASLLAISAALYISGKAIKEFVSVKWEDMVKATVALIGFSKVSELLGKSTPMSLMGALGIAALGASLWVAGAALKQFTDVKWETIAKGTVAMAALAGAGVLLAEVAVPMLLGSLGLGAMSAALWVTGAAMKQFTDVKWADVGVAVLALGGIALASIALAEASPLMLLGALGLGAISAALWITGAALKQFADVKFSDVLAATAAMGGIAIAGSMLAEASPLMLLGALGLGAMSAALWLTGAALKQFAEVTLSDMGSAIAAMASLSLVSGALAIASPLMLIGAIGLGALSAALWITGAALKQFSKVKASDILAATEALGSITLMSAGLAFVSPMMLVASLGLGAISAALWLTGAALKQFADVNWDSVTAGFSAIGGLGLMTLKLAFVAPLMPVVALGLVVLGGAIAILGFALNSFAGNINSFVDGITSISNINGENLVKVAKGIFILGGALAAFSAGNFAASVGNVFSTITNGISSALGGSSVIDQISKFAALGPGLDLSANAIKTVSTSVDSMIASLNSFTNLDTLKDMVSTINTIDVDKATAFGSIGKINTTSLPELKSPSGEIAIQQPQSESISSPASSLEKSENEEQAGNKTEAKNAQIAESRKATANNAEMIGLLTDQVAILTQILLSTNSNVSVNKDILRYARNN